MITVTFHCGGCDAKAEGTRPIRQRFEGIAGKPWGFGTYVTDNIEDVAPEGWIVFDLIGCTYCPACADEIAEAVA